MKDHQKKILISYRWFRQNGEKLIEDHIGALDETAMDHIFEKAKDGFVGGELFDNIFMNDSDIENGEEGISYRGYWSVAKE